MFISVFSSKKLLIATKNKDAFHLHMKYIDIYENSTIVMLTHTDPAVEMCIQTQRTS